MDVNAWLVSVGGSVILVGMIWFVVEFIRDRIDGWRENRGQGGGNR